MVAAVCVCQLLGEKYNEANKIFNRRVCDTVCATPRAFHLQMTIRGTARSAQLY